MGAGWVSWLKGMGHGNEGEVCGRRGKVGEGRERGEGASVGGR